MPGIQPLGCGPLIVVVGVCILYAVHFRGHFIESELVSSREGLQECGRLCQGLREQALGNWIVGLGEGNERN